MKLNSILFLLFLFFLFKCSKTLELYSTYKNIGISKYSTKESCSVRYCKTSKNVCEDGHPLSEITQGRFVGSIFWLQSNTEYEVTVSCGSDVTSSTISTKKELSTPTKENGQILRTLYVSVDGKDTKCTNIDYPCNVTYLFSKKIDSGTEILFKNGFYNIGKTVISSEATEDYPILLKPLEDNGNVIFDGSETIQSQEWQNLGNGIFRIYRTIKSNEDYQNLVLVNKNTQEQTRLLRYLVRNDFESLSRISPVTKTGNFGYFFDQDQGYIDINIGESLDLNNFEIKRSILGYAFQINSNYVYLHGLKFQYFGEGHTYKMAIYIRNSSNIWIKGCKFDHNFRGICLKYKTHDILIEDNDFTDSKYELNWDGVKDSNGDKNMEQGAIQFYESDPNTKDDIVGRGLVIRNNYFFGFFDAFSISPSLPNDSTYYTFKTNEIDIHDNFISNCRDDGFQLDKVSSNIRVYNNRIEKTLVAISLAPHYPGPTYIFNNTITNVIGWTSFKFQYGIEDIPSGIAFFYHNLIWNKIAGNGLSIVHFPWTKQKYRNNIFFGYSRAIKLSHFNLEYIDLDYDALFREDTNQYNRFTVETTQFRTFQEFSNSTNQEKHGIYINELNEIFKNEEFELNNSCVLKGNAEFIPGISDKNQLDIGLIFNQNEENKSILNSISPTILFFIFFISFFH